MPRRRGSEHVEALASVPLFRGLSKAHLREVARVAFEETYAPEEAIVREHDAGQKLVVLVSGHGRVEKGGKAIGRVGQGEVVGEMSLIDGLPRSASVIAETPVEALVVHRTDFRRLLDAIPSLWEKLLLAQTARLRQVDREAATLG